MSRESGTTAGESLVRQGYRSLAWDSEGQRQVGLRLCPRIGQLLWPQSRGAFSAEKRVGARRPRPRLRLTKRVPPSRPEGRFGETGASGGEPGSGRASIEGM